jgi:hypothetical protein
LTVKVLILAGDWPAQDILNRVVIGNSVLVCSCWLEVGASLRSIRGGNGHDEPVNGVGCYIVRPGGIGAVIAVHLRYQKSGMTSFSRQDNGLLQSQNLIQREIGARFKIHRILRILMLDTSCCML